MVRQLWLNSKHIRELRKASIVIPQSCSTRFASVARCLAVVLVSAFALNAAADVPTTTTAPALSTHQSATAAGAPGIPASNTFSYAGLGDNEHGHYKVFFYTLTKPEQYLKHLLIWARIDWTEAQKIGATTYQSELMLFHIDCKAKQYVISSRIWLDAHGVQVKRVDLKPAEYRVELMPMSDNPAFVVGKSSAELGAANQFTDGCEPYD